MPSNGSSRKSRRGPWMSAQPERELLLHAVAVLADELPRVRRELERLEQLVGAPARLARGRGRRAARGCGAAPRRRAARRARGRPAPPPPARFTSSGSRARSTPSTCARPAVGASSPVSILMVVLFPAPFGPEEAVERARGDGEREVLHRRPSVEEPREALRLDGEHRVPVGTAGRHLAGRAAGGRPSSQCRSARHRARPARSTGSARPCPRSASGPRSATRRRPSRWHT